MRIVKPLPTPPEPFLSGVSDFEFVSQLAIPTVLGAFTVAVGAGSLLAALAATRIAQTAQRHEQAAEERAVAREERVELTALIGEALNWARRRFADDDPMSLIDSGFVALEARFRSSGLRGTDHAIDLLGALSNLDVDDDCASVRHEVNTWRRAEVSLICNELSGAPEELERRSRKSVESNGWSVRHFARQRAREARFRRGAAGRILRLLPKRARLAVNRRVQQHWNRLDDEAVRQRS